MKRASPLRKKRKRNMNEALGGGLSLGTAKAHRTPTAKGHTIFRKAGYKERQREVSF